MLLYSIFFFPDLASMLKMCCWSQNWVMVRARVRVRKRRGEDARSQNWKNNTERNTHGNTLHFFWHVVGDVKYFFVSAWKNRQSFATVT